MKADKSDLEKLRLEMKKYTDNECSQVEKMANEKFENLRAMLDALKQEILRNKAEFDQFKQKDFAALEARVTALEKRLQAILKQLEDLRGHQQLPSGPGIDNSALEDIYAKLADLDNKILQMWDDIQKQLKDIWDALNQKANIADLTELEKLFTERLNEIVLRLTKQFADKNETKKAFKAHER